MALDPPHGRAEPQTLAPIQGLSGRKLEVALALIRGGPALILVALFVAASLASPYFFTLTNLQNLGVQSSIVAALALGQLLVIIARGIDISVGAVVALSTVVGINATQSGWPAAAVIAAILATGLAVGTANALLIVKGGIAQPLIVTLAMLGIAKSLGLVLSDGRTETGMPHAVVTAGSGYVGEFPVPVLLVCAATLLVFVATTKTRWGRWLYAVGGNPDAARRLGLPVNGIVMSAYIVCGLCAGFAGLIVAGRTDAGSPTSGDLLELDAITAVIIGGASLFGGRGSALNAVIGALILGTIRNGLDLLGVTPFYQLLATGIVILLALELDVIRGKLEERLRVRQAVRA